MDKAKQILTFLVITVIIAAITGCVSNGDIGAAIDSWNKIHEKDTQISKAYEDSLSSINTKSDNLNVIKRSVQQSKSYLDTTQKLLEEEDSLITDFAGNTAKLSGEAKTYGNDMLINVREAYGYKVKMLNEQQKIISNFEDMIAAEESGESDTANALLSDLEDSAANRDSYGLKADEHISKANDAMKKLEALQ